MIGAPIGGAAIGAAFPADTANIFEQSVTANVDASVSVVKSISKIVTAAAVDLAVTLGNFSIGKIVSAAADASVSVVKAVTFTVTAATIDATATIVKTTSKLVPAASIDVSVGAITKAVGKLVSAGIDASVSITRAISFAVSVSMTAATSITTLRRHPGRALLSRISNRRRTFWRGAR